MLAAGAFLLVAAACTSGGGASPSARSVPPSIAGSVVQDRPAAAACAALRPPRGHAPIGTTDARGDLRVIGQRGAAARRSTSALGALDALARAYAPQIAAYRSRFGPVDGRKAVFLAATDTFDGKVLFRNEKVPLTDLEGRYGMGFGQPAPTNPCADLRVSYMTCMDRQGVDVVVPEFLAVARWVIPDAPRATLTATSRELLSTNNYVETAVYAGLFPKQ